MSLYPLLEPSIFPSQVNLSTSLFLGHFDTHIEFPIDVVIIFMPLQLLLKLVKQ
jgi:hypothetical protein